jgi:hypothetical protein
MAFPGFDFVVILQAAAARGARDPGEVRAYG